MKIVKNLSIISIIISVIGIAGLLLLAFQPYTMYDLFGMSRYVPVRVFSDGDAMPSNLYPLAAAAMTVQLLLVILAALLAMYGKLKKLALFFGIISLPSLYIAQNMSEFFDNWGFSENELARMGFRSFNSICRFWLVVVLAAAALCLISVILTDKSTSRSMAAVSVATLVLFLTAMIFNGLVYRDETDYFLFFVLPYIITAVIFIVLNIMTITKKAGYSAGLTAIVFTALFPLTLHLSNMFLSGDYYGIMNLNGESGYADFFMTLWYLGGCASAAAAIKNENERNNQE